jgi:hypothetical protein
MKPLYLLLALLLLPTFSSAALIYNQPNFISGTQGSATSSIVSLNSANSYILDKIEFQSQNLFYYSCNNSVSINAPECFSPIVVIASAGGTPLYYNDCITSNTSPPYLYSCSFSNHFDINSNSNIFDYQPITVGNTFSNIPINITNSSSNRIMIIGLRCYNRCAGGTAGTFFPLGYQYYGTGNLPVNSLNLNSIFIYSSSTSAYLLRFQNGTPSNITAGVNPVNFSINVQNLGNTARNAMIRIYNNSNFALDVSLGSVPGNSNINLNTSVALPTGSYSWSPYWNFTPSDPSIIYPSPVYTFGVGVSPPQGSTVPVFSTSTVSSNSEYISNPTYFSTSTGSVQADCSVYGTVSFANLACLIQNGFTYLFYPQNFQYSKDLVLAKAQNAFPFNYFIVTWDLFDNWSTEVSSQASSTVTWTVPFTATSTTGKITIFDFSKTGKIYDILHYMRDVFGLLIYFLFTLSFVFFFIRKVSNPNSKL